MMLQFLSDHARSLRGIVLAVSSSLLAFLAAWVDRFGGGPFGLWHLRHFGWGIVTALGFLVVYRVLARHLTVWVFVAVVLLGGSLLVDSLPLRSFPKAQCALALVALSQWSSCQESSGSRYRKAQLALVCFALGALIESAYFLSMLWGRGFTGIF